MYRRARNPRIVSWYNANNLERFYCLIEKEKKKKPKKDFGRKRSKLCILCYCQCEKIRPSAKSANECFIQKHIKCNCLEYVFQNCAENTRLSRDNIKHKRQSTFWSGLTASRVFPFSARCCY